MALTASLVPPVRVTVTVAVPAFSIWLNAATLKPMRLSLSTIVTVAFVNPSRAGAVEALVARPTVNRRIPSARRLSRIGTVKLALNWPTAKLRFVLTAVKSVPANAVPGAV